VTGPVARFALPLFRLKVKWKGVIFWPETSVPFGSLPDAMDCNGESGVITTDWPVSKLPTPL